MNFTSISEKDPKVIDPRTGQPISEPPSDLEKVAPSERVEWGTEQRDEFKSQWESKGYKEPLVDGIFMIFII